MIYFEIKRIQDDKVISGNLKTFLEYRKFEKEKNQTAEKHKIKSRYQEFDNISVWMIVVGEDDLYKSNNLLKRVMRAYGECANALFPYYFKKINDHSHALRTIQAQMRQKIDGFARAKDFRGHNYEESKSNIGQLVSDNIPVTADTLCYLNKRVIDMEVHIGGFDILYNNSFSSSDTRCKNVNIKKVLQNIIAPFFESLAEQYITIIFNGITDEYALDNQVKINYKIFHLAMYNFFNNVAKYAKPYSNIKITFEKNKNDFELSFEMISYRIDKDEITEIFKDGYCGRHASGCGDGIGMFVAKKALNLINLDIKVIPNYRQIEKDGEEVFVKNVFQIFNNNNLKAEKIC